MTTTMEVQAKSLDRGGGAGLARAEDGEPGPIYVNNEYEHEASDILDAREQRSHISIIQMAPPAPSSSKTSRGCINHKGNTDPEREHNGESVPVMKTGKSANNSTGKRQRAAGVPRGENVPNKKKRHHCSVQGCSYNTPHTKDLARHMRKHTSEKPFRCDRCDKSFTRYDKLVIHIRRHEGHRPFSCQFCNYTATDSSSLRKHHRKHSDERPYKCQLCPYSSKDSSQLIVHLRHHTGDSPYVCVFEGCDASFKTPSDLSRHARLHTGEKPYKCTYCDYRAAVKSNLNVHMKRHTNPRPKNGRKGVPRVNDVEEDDGDGDSGSEALVAIPPPEVPRSTKSNQGVLPFQYACKLCDHKADTIDMFTLHMEESHPNSDLTIASRVDPSKTSKGRPPKKLKDFAEDQRIFQCSSCNAAFKCENSLRCHMRQHGTVPNKPADVNPEIYSPTPTPNHYHRTSHSHSRNHHNLYRSTTEYSDNENNSIQVHSNPNVDVSSYSDPDIQNNPTEEEENTSGYTLHEMQRLPPAIQSVITENPTVISNNTNGGIIGTPIMEHYDPATGHLYVVSYTNELHPRWATATPPPQWQLPQINNDDVYHIRDPRE